MAAEHGWNSRRAGADEGQRGACLGKVTVTGARRARGVVENEFRQAGIVAEHGAGRIDPRGNVPAVVVPRRLTKMPAIRR